jgi:hypothetical protein
MNMETAVRAKEFFEAERAMLRAYGDLVGNRLHVPGSPMPSGVVFAAIEDLGPNDARELADYFEIQSRIAQAWERMVASTFVNARDRLYEPTGSAGVPLHNLNDTQAHAAYMKCCRHLHDVDRRIAGLRGTSGGTL